MIHFSDISNNSLLGKFLRLPLKIIPESFILPILQGPNKEFKWIKGSGVNGYWLGSFEISKQKLIASYVKEGMVCYDIGTHVGFYSLMFSRLSGKKGKVFSFEPNPFNLFFFLRHLRLNKITNVDVFPIALYEEEDFMPFVLNSSMSHLNKREKENFWVPVFKIDDLISKGYLLAPDIVKIDAEGAELEILKGMRNCLEYKSIILFVALDDRQKRGEVFNFLSRVGYNVYSLEGREIDPKGIYSIDEIIASAHPRL